jgi:hypothetical protein
MKGQGGGQGQGHGQGQDQQGQGKGLIEDEEANLIFQKRNTQK